MTYALTGRQVANLIDAAAFAGQMGKPLNRHCSAHFALIGREDRDGFETLQAFLKLAREWCYRQGGDLAYVWTRESAEIGTHAHILFHVPPVIEAAFARLLWRWMKQACGGAYVRGACYSRRVQGWVSYQRGEPETFDANHSAVLHYILKGADGEAVARHALTKRQAGGGVVGKRCGTSQNIGKSARLQASARRCQSHSSEQPISHSIS
ncbi:MAG: hypothetical protein ABNH53_06570 [Henriciella sp.]